jgi:hypothetical protein
MSNTETDQKPKITFKGTPLEIQRKPGSPALFDVAEVPLLPFNTNMDLLVVTQTEEMLAQGKVHHTDHVSDILVIKDIYYRYKGEIIKNSVNILSTPDARRTAQSFYGFLVLREDYAHRFYGTLDHFAGNFFLECAVIQEGAEALGFTIEGGRYQIEGNAE